MNINIDFDSVMVNTTEEWVKDINFDYGTNVKYTDIKDWDMSLAFPSLAKSAIYYPLTRRSLWEKVKPIKDSQKIVQKLLNDKHDIKVVSDTDYRNVQIKTEIMMKHFPCLESTDFVSIKDKSRYTGDVLLDDYLDKLIGFNGYRCLFSQPWNEKYDYKALSALHIQRVDNWMEFYKLITEMEQTI